MKQAEFIERFQLFTEESLKWCTKEAEKGTERVTQAVEILLKDTKRVSEVSSDSIKAIENLQHLMRGLQADDLANLKKSLSVLSKDHKEIDSFIQPILQSLQFQDRLRQNLENIGFMMKVWSEERIKHKKTRSLEELQEFGRKLMAKTTMVRERDVIRDYIPGLDNEGPVMAVNLF